MVEEHCGLGLMVMGYCIVRLQADYVIFLLPVSGMQVEELIARVTITNPSDAGARSVNRAFQGCMAEAFFFFKSFLSSISSSVSERLSWAWSRRKMTSRTAKICSLIEPSFRCP